MTRTGPAHVAMPARRHTPSRRPALTRPSSRHVVFVLPATDVPPIARAVLPGKKLLKPGPGRLTARPGTAWPGRLRPVGRAPRRRRIGAPCPPCSRLPAHPLYLYLLKRPAIALSECSFDPGRDMLCILTSPPRWLQWP
jgi:hypothetical protein